MKLKLLPWVVLFWCLTTTTIQAQVSIKCLQNLTIRMARGGTELANCVGDGMVDTVKFRPSTLATPIYYLVTGEDLTIRAASLKPTIDFEVLGPGTYRVYALSFVGRSYVEVGMNAGTDELASTCYELSKNYIPVRNIDPDGQSVSTIEGATSLLTCTGDGNADLIDFHTSSPDPFYVYLITNQNNVIQAVSRAPNFDFEGGPADTLRVWGLSFVGGLLAAPGQDLTTAILAENCFDLSDNYIEIIKTIPDGGNVSLSGGGDQTLICINERADVLNFESTGNDNTPYTFMLTNADNTIIEIMSGDERDFNDLPEGTFRVWGLSYTGELIAAAGDDALATPLSNDCYDLSDNFVTIRRKAVDGGRVRSLSPDQRLRICVDDGTPALLRFEGESNADALYAFIVTDREDRILFTSNRSEINFEGQSAGQARVYGLSYTGRLTAPPGSDIHDSALADECYDLSENFITIARIVLNGGSVRLSDGSVSAAFCSDAASADQALQFSTTGGQYRSYTYLVTDEADRIVTIAPDGFVDFSTLPAANYRVWGVNYTGELIALPGQNATQTVLSSECYERSDNFVSITVTPISGGRIQLTGGATSATVCNNDGADATLRLRRQGAQGSYAYLLIDAATNSIVRIIRGSTLTLSDTPENTAFDIYGLAYAGELAIAVGDLWDPVGVAALSCHSLSANKLRIEGIYLSVDAFGFATGDPTTALACLDEHPGTFALSVIYSGAAFRTIITDEQDRFIAFSEADRADLSPYGPGTYHLYGVALSDTALITIERGDPVPTTPISSGCYRLTDSFNVARLVDVEGGALSLANGAVTARRCLSDDGGATRITAVTRSAAPASYAFLITDENNIVEAISDSPAIALNGHADRRIWGLSYSGSLLVTPGDDAAATALSTECYDLSDNFLFVQTRIVAGGAIELSNGARQTTSCPGEDLLDFTVSGASQTANGVLLITGPDNTIRSVAPPGALDFSQAAPGSYRVWHLSYTGTLTAAPGDDAGTAMLSDECFDLSANFVTVRRFVPDAGTVSLEGGDTQQVCLIDGRPDTIRATTTSNSPDYLFLLVNRRNFEVVEASKTGVFTFAEPAPEEADNYFGKLTVLGIAHSGDLTIDAGSRLTPDFADNLSCAAVSSDLETSRTPLITTYYLHAPELSLEGGGMSTSICLDGRSGSTLSINPGDFIAGAYIYLLTDPENRLLAATGSAIDFQNFGAGEYLVYGLASINGLPDDFQMGQLLPDIASGKCYARTENAIAVTVENVLAGPIRLSDGTTAGAASVGDDTPDLFEFVAPEAPAESSLRYLITDEANRLLKIIEGDRFDFDSSEPGICRIWGLTYTGQLLIEPGALITEAQLSSGCYSLSTNFISILRKSLLGGILTLPDGSTTTEICAIDEVPDTITVLNSGQSTVAYTYLLTDSENTIILIDDGPQIDCSALPAGEYRIRGLAYSGNLLARAGDNALGDPLSDEFFNLSDNFITVKSPAIEGGGIAFINEEAPPILCAGDGRPDSIAVEASGNTGAYSFLLIDPVSGLITNISREGIFTGTQWEADGTLTVIGVASATPLDIPPGTPFNALTDGLTNVGTCFDLSNQLEVTVTFERGASIFFEGGGEEQIACVGDGASDVLRFRQNSSSYTNYAFLITDVNNIVRTILPGPLAAEYDFESSGPGVDRIWGVAYSGMLTVRPGDDVAAAPLADGCYGLSGNYLSVEKRRVDGGTVAIAGGAQRGTACVGDGNPDVFEFVSATSSTADYAFIVTDDNDQILVVLAGNRINFDVAPAGTCRVYGVSYTGNLTNLINTSIGDLPLSDECYELSENFIRIAKERAEGGSIALTEGGDLAFTCPADDLPDPVVVTADGSSTGGYVYVLTDQEDSIIAVTAQPVVDFEGADPGTYRLWGLAYTGRLLAMPGALVSGTVLSDGCYELTGNFVTVVHEAPLGGTVRLSDGRTERLSCPGAAVPPVLDFVSENAMASAFTYLVTDPDNVIRAVPTGTSFDFSNLPIGSYRVWGLGYNGTLLAQPGDDADNNPLSDNCYTLSDNFISVVNQEPVGGRIATESGKTEIFTCPGDGNADVIRFDSSGVTGRYAYLLTDANNNILSVSEADSFDFEAPQPAISRVWGLAFIGELLAEAGQNAAEAKLASECFVLSDNFVRVTRSVPEAGTIVVREPEGEFTFCAGDGRPDLMIFAREGASPTPYYYLLTDEANRLISYTTTDQIDIDTTGGGAARIWGLAFTGTPQLQPGTVITEVPLSDDCYDLSDNNIFIDRTEVDGATISSDRGEHPIYICRGDGVDDILTFSNSSEAAASGYAYAITNLDNTILRIVEGDRQNFENLGLPELRIRGISYTGNLTAMAGQNIESAILSSGCYALSDNFLQVLLDQPEGGFVQTTAGSTDISICIGIDEALLTFENSSTARLGYRYLMTDNANGIIAVLESDTLDFSTVGNGNYRIWGLSYASPLLALPGLEADTDALSGNCYELSTNFISVRKGGPIDGGSISTNRGETTLTTCPQNGVPDLVVLENTSTAMPPSDYRYLIADTTDRIVIPDVEGNVLDFDGAAPGVYRICGLSYTGTFRASFGQDIFASVLSDECYELSANFVTIEHQGPQGGQIATTEGLSGTLTTAACGGAVSDLLSFTDNGTATGAEGYAFLVSRRDTILAVLQEGDSYDFSALLCGSDYLVQGLAYQGTLPDLTGAMITDLLSGDLIAACFDLSDNQLLIAQPESGLQDGTADPRYQSSIQQLSDLRLSPVPAREHLQVRFELQGPVPEQAELGLIDGAGKVLRRLTAGIREGDNLLELDIRELPEGLFFLHLRAGGAMRYQRFVKIR